MKSAQAPAAFNGPVENPALKKAIEACNSGITAENFDTFKQALASSLLINAVEIEGAAPEASGTLLTELTPGTNIAINVFADKDNKQFVPLFTDWDEVKKYTDRPVQGVVSTFSGHMSFVTGNKYEGIVLNPASNGPIFGGEGLSKLLNDINSMIKLGNLTVSIRVPLAQGYPQPNQNIPALLQKLKAEPNQHNFDNVLAEVVRSNFVVLHDPALGQVKWNNDNGQIISEPNSQFAFAVVVDVYGNKIIPFFTDEEHTKNYPAEGLEPLTLTIGQILELALSQQADLIKLNLGPDELSIDPGIMENMLEYIYSHSEN